MMVPSFTADDIDVLFDWLLSPIPPSDPTSPNTSSKHSPSTPHASSTSQNFGLAMKAKVLEIFYEEFRQKPHLEQYLRAGSGMHVVFYFCVLFCFMINKKVVSL
jgi:hypothetical protein